MATKCHPRVHRQRVAVPGDRGDDAVGAYAPDDPVARIGDVDRSIRYPHRARRCCPTPERRSPDRRLRRNRIRRYRPRLRVRPRASRGARGPGSRCRCFRPRRPRRTGGSRQPPRPRSSQWGRRLCRHCQPRARPPGAGCHRDRAFRRFPGRGSRSPDRACGARSRSNPPGRRRWFAHPTRRVGSYWPC